MPCRICTSNDHEALIAQLAEEIWNTRASTDPADEWRPWDRAGDYWQMVFRDHAIGVLKVALRDAPAGPGYEG